jgi:NitT/TauT family transport system permease protein
MMTETVNTGLVAESNRERRFFASRAWRDWRDRGVVIASLIIFFAAWQVAVMALNVPAYVLPPPSKILLAFVDGISVSPFSRSSFWFHLADTLKAAVAGFFIAAFLATLIASLMAEVRIIEKVVMPYVAGLQAVPKLAVAPLFIIWFGYGIESKIALAALIGFFPMLINSFEGLQYVPPDRLELMRSLRCSAWQTFWRVKFPGALPMITTGMNLGIVYALLGAVVAEFIGASRGVGVIILQLQSTVDTAGIFAVILLLAIASYALLTLLRFFQRKIVFWEQPQRNRGD